MQITRLEVFGFKSFMDRLVLPLEGGVTGVVGPNGCGKSNIVDALRWVLGETRAKNLRGGVLEDVIFNGTDKLRPLGLAEVTLTIRASGDNFFADVVSPDLEAELAAEREMEQASKFVEQKAEEIDAVEAELQEGEAGTQELSASEDVNEEQSFAQSARPKLTVIPGRLNEPEQGENNGVSEPVEQTAQQAAENAQNSATLMNRFSWLKSANEVQVTRRLYRSGESEFFINRVPCRLKDLKEFFRAIGFGVKAHTIVAQGEVARIISAKPEERRIILEEAAGVLGFRDKIKSAERRLDDTDINISRLDDIIKEVTRQVNSLRRQAARAKNRQSLKDRIAELERILQRIKFVSTSSQLVQIEDRLEELQQQTGGVEARLEKLQAEEHEARASLVSVDLEGDDIRSKIDSIKEELNTRARQRAERNARVSELKAFALARETEIKRLEERKKTLLERVENSEQAITSIGNQKVELEKEIETLDVQGGEQQVQTYEQQISELRKSLREYEQQLRGVQSELSRSQGALETIERQLVAASPINQLKKTLNDTAASALNELASGAHLLIDDLKVPDQYVKAVQAALAEKAGFLVSEKPFEVAGKFIQHVLSHAKKDQQGLGLGVFRSGESETQNAQATALPFKALLELVEFSPQSGLALKECLSGTYFVETLEQGIQFFEQNPQAVSIRLVTAEGDLLSANSFFSLRHEGGILHLKNRAAELEKTCEQMIEKQSLISQSIAESNATLENTEKLRREVVAELRSRQERMRNLSKELGQIDARIESEKRAVGQAELDLSKVDEQVADARLKIKEFEGERERVEQEIQALVPEEEGQLHEALRELNQSYGTLDDSRREGRKALAELAEQVESVRRELDRLRSQGSDKQLELQKMRIELEHLKERVIEEYGEEAWQECSAESGPELEFTPAQQLEMREEISKLKSRIAREGEVDPTSIERFEEEQKRLEELEVQHKDLQMAAATLKRTIERLRDTSEKKFLSTFQAMQENFSKLIPTLFGGGRGSLELVDPEKPLDTGVEIVVRPPGKKLKSIDLLSGGEKALCATALIFAMFLERPSPLCVLDEVDAPLDEANLQRFLGFLKEMSKKTQFLMITHNKASMSVCDKLVGVTMEQPGASKTLTVSLQDAYNQVA